MNDLYIIEKNDDKKEEFSYLHVSSEAINQKQHMFKWTKKLSDVKIFRNHKEANKYESIYNAVYLNVWKVKKRRLIILKDDMIKIPAMTTIEIF